MADLVTIRTEGMNPLTRGKDVPRKKWKFLLSARASYCIDQFQQDCRELLLFIDDGRENGFFGYPDEVTYLREGLSLEPEAVSFAENYLRVRKARLEAGMGGHDWREIPFDQAVALGKRGRDEAAERDERGRYLKSKGSNTTFGRGADYILARLDRDGHTELAAKVRAGELSANAAAIAAGFRKKSEPFETVLRLLPKLTVRERTRLRAKLDELDRSQPAAAE